MSQIDITRWLVEVNAPASEGSWRYRSIGYILNNKKYLGTDIFPAIISKDIYLKVQRIRYGEGRYKSTYYNHTPYNKKKKYPFTSMIVCEKCNETCKSSIIYPNKPHKHQVWRCGNYVFEGKVECRISIDNKELEQLFVEVFTEFYSKLNMCCKKL